MRNTACNDAIGIFWLKPQPTLITELTAKCVQINTKLQNKVILNF